MNSDFIVLKDKHNKVKKCIVNGKNKVLHVRNDKKDTNKYVKHNKEYIKKEEYRKRIYKKKIIKGGSGEFFVNFNKNNLEIFNEKQDNMIGENIFLHNDKFNIYYYDKVIKKKEDDVIQSNTIIWFQYIFKEIMQLSKNIENVKLEELIKLCEDYHENITKNGEIIPTKAKTILLSQNGYTFSFLDITGNNIKKYEGLPQLKIDNGVSKILLDDKGKLGENNVNNITILFDYIIKPHIDIFFKYDNLNFYKYKELFKKEYLKRNYYDAVKGILIDVEDKDRLVEWLKTEEHSTKENGVNQNEVLLNMINKPDIDVQISKDSYNKAVALVEDFKSSSLSKSRDSQQQPQSKQEKITSSITVKQPNTESTTTSSLYSSKQQNEKLETKPSQPQKPVKQQLEEAQVSTPESETTTPSQPTTLSRQLTSTILSQPKPITQQTNAINISSQPEPAYVQQVTPETNNQTLSNQQKTSAQKTYKRQESLEEYQNFLPNSLKKNVRPTSASGKLQSSTTNSSTNKSSSPLPKPAWGEQKQNDTSSTIISNGIPSQFQLDKHKIEAQQSLFSKREEKPKVPLRSKSANDLKSQNSLLESKIIVQPFQIPTRGVSNQVSNTTNSQKDTNEIYIGDNSKKASNFSLLYLKPEPKPEQYPHESSPYVPNEPSGLANKLFEQGENADKDAVRKQNEKKKQEIAQNMLSAMQRKKEAEELAKKQAKKTAQNNESKRIFTNLEEELLRQKSILRKGIIYVEFYKQMSDILDDMKIKSFRDYKKDILESFLNKNKNLLNDNITKIFKDIEEKRETLVLSKKDERKYITKDEIIAIIDKYVL